MPLGKLGTGKIIGICGDLGQPRNIVRTALILTGKFIRRRNGQRQASVQKTRRSPVVGGIVTALLS